MINLIILKMCRWNAPEEVSQEYNIPYDQEVNKTKTNKQISENKIVYRVLTDLRQYCQQNLIQNFNYMYRYNLNYIPKSIRNIKYIVCTIQIKQKPAKKHPNI